MAEDFQRHVAGQGDGVEKLALAERHGEGDFMRVGKRDGLRGLGAHCTAGKGEGDVGDAEFGLVDDEGGSVGGRSEGDHPWAVLHAAVFDEGEGGDIEKESDEEEGDKGFGGAHAKLFASGREMSSARAIESY